MKKIFLLLATLCLLWTPNLRAQDCPDSLESMPILKGGRVKPLFTHAKEIIKFITGKSGIADLSATQVYCQLSLEATAPQKISQKIRIIVPHIKTREFLELPAHQDNINFKQAKKHLEEALKTAPTLESREDASAFSKDLKAFVVRVQLLDEIINGENWVVPNFSEDNNLSWIPVKTEWENWHNAPPTKAENFSQHLNGIADNFSNLQGNHYLLELKYEKLQLIQWAILAVLTCLGLGLLFRRHDRPAVMVCLIGVFIIEITAITLRVMISGRGPVTNMYETVMWVGFGGLFFATILAFIRREILFLSVGLTLNLACLFMMTFATDMLDPAIKPLVPVLRDNFWLSTHVTTITISYAAFALSWILSDYYMVKTMFFKPLPTETLYINNLCYDCLKIGVVLLALGIILGGIWADYSWGRFWGWDPKETWALAALLIYIAILHGRFSGWIKAEWFIPFTGLAFLGIIMAWFGVNYILAAGLHSYGFSEGGRLFILLLAAVQVVVFAIYVLRIRKSKSPAC